jgi:hypothetical protein
MRAGYAVTGVFAEISIEESVRRCEAEHRRKHDDYRKGVGYGGRYVRPHAIRAPGRRYGCPGGRSRYVIELGARAPE